MTPSHLMIAGGVVLGASLIPGLATTAKGYFKKVVTPSEPLYTGLPAEPAPPGAVALAPGEGGPRVPPNSIVVVLRVR